jgi:predicted SprT family Zn-dependent metalloprotease
METTTQKLNAAATLTRNLLAENGIQGVTVKFNTNKGRLGVCKYRNRVPTVIEFSRTIAAHLPLVDILNTARHEVAHAIAGYEAGHGYEWLLACHQVGLMNPERTFAKTSEGTSFREIKKQIAAYMFVCEKHSQGCTFEMPFHRMTEKRQRELDRGSCPKCRSKIKLL